MATRRSGSAWVEDAEGEACGSGQLGFKLLCHVAGMTCVICKYGETRAGETTVSLTRGESTVVIKQVPADICDNCGEYYLSEKVSSVVLARAEQAVRNGAEVEILRYAA